MGNKKIINELVTINNDRKAGYESIMVDIDDQNDRDLKEVFQANIDQSEAFVRELEESPSVSEIDLDTGKSALGALHRVWLDLKSALNGAHRMGILKEVWRGEEEIRDAYERSLEEVEKNSRLEQTIQKQLDEILASQEKIRALAEQ